MNLIYPELSYARALELSGLLTLYDRREAISAKLFHEMCANQSHRLHKLLPNEYQPSYSLREQRTFIRSKCIKLKEARVVFFEVMFTIVEN